VHPRLGTRRPPPGGGSLARRAMRRGRWVASLTGGALVVGVIGTAGADSAHPELTAHARDLLLGQGWGCARLESEVGGAWACWRAPGPAGQGTRTPRAITSWRVPWLSGRSP